MSKIVDLEKYINSLRITLAKHSYDDSSLAEITNKIFKNFLGDLEAIPTIEAIVLPCKVGDKVYPLTYGVHDEVMVTSIQYTNDIRYEHACVEIETETADHAYYDVFEIDDIGVRVFLNKEERDKALQEAIERGAQNEID